MNEFVAQFLLESREYVEQATQDLLALEKTPQDTERLASAFRAFHTLKGGAGIVDFAAMSRALHAGEDALVGARAGSLPITAQFVGDCLACLDQVAQWLDAMQDTGDIPQQAERDADAVIARFENSASRARSAGVQTAAPQEAVAAAGWVDAMLIKYPGAKSQARCAIRYAPDPDCFFKSEDPLHRMAELPGLLALDLIPRKPWPPLDEIDPFVCNLVLLALTQSTPGEAAAALADVKHQVEIRSLEDAASSGGDALSLPQQARAVLEAQIELLAETSASGAAGRIGSAGAVAANIMRFLARISDADAIASATASALTGNEPDALREAIEAALGGTNAPTATSAPETVHHEVAAQTLRVDASRIDALVNLTGELTVAKNALGHAARLAQEGNSVLATLLKDRHAVFDRLVGELQQSVLGMRVLPLRHVFQRFPRQVREMSAELNKAANLVIEGGDTEADKAIVEMLFEPLLHVLRNAIDHGIETAAERASTDKPPAATILLRAFREGEHVVVEVRDDGRGIDVARVRRAAQERKLFDAEALAAMSDEEVVNLIFTAGFSTADKVTGLSGRGVGMDAVRSAVERLGGHVVIDTHPARGTMVRFTLPFSVMMTRVMIVEAGGQKFGIPLDAMVETISVPVGRIAPVGAAQAIVLRNRTIPLVELSAALDLKNDVPGDAARAGTDAIVVIARIDGQLGALRVDRLTERMEVMLKPLDGLLAGMPGIAGSTLLGDGSVLLVLDLGELFQ